MQKPNRLAAESSPYLLQHAHNPVDWLPFGDEAFALARSADKPLLISIGYSACHWCHVMAHESFENEEIAALMNAHFVCVKVDREERPDVDHVYMDAVQLLHGNGGWPLNCFALPDGRPFWGGTYFRPEQWKQLLLQVHELYKTSYDSLEAQADSLAEGVRSQHESLFAAGASEPSGEVDLRQAFDMLSRNFDHEKGGFAGAPKFPMPVVLNFLLQYGSLDHSAEAVAMVETTLDHMMRGGIFDQAGGGFARYSTDSDWKVPHFEKMLYDNAQLVSLLSAIYSQTGNPAYAECINQTLAFVERELTSPSALFYSALDADSDGCEGLYYTYTEAEFSEATGAYAALMGEYFGIGRQGLWENDRNILLRPYNDGQFAQQHFLSQTELSALAAYCRSQLLSVRTGRVAPGLDDKSIASWNAMMAEAFADAYLATRNLHYLQVAEKAAAALLELLKTSGGGLFHTWKAGRAAIPAFADDYAFAAKAMLKLYTLTLNEKWLREAENFMQYALEHFYNESTGFFRYSDKTGKQLFAAKTDIGDGVIPSANSVFCGLMNRLALLLHQPDWSGISNRMLAAMSSRISMHPAAYAGWASTKLTQNKYLIAVAGENARAITLELLRHYLPNAVICGTEKPSPLPAFEGRYAEGKTLIYLCTCTYCLPPVESTADALLLLEKQRNGQE